MAETAKKFEKSKTALLCIGCLVLFLAATIGQLFLLYIVVKEFNPSVSHSGRAILLLLVISFAPAALIVANIYAFIRLCKNYLRDKPLNLWNEATLIALNSCTLVPFWILCLWASGF